VTGSCEHINEPWDSLRGQFLGWLSDYQLVTKDFAPWSQSILIFYEPASVMEILRTAASVSSSTGACPTSCTMGGGDSSPGVGGRGVKLTTQLHEAPRLTMGGAIPPLPHARVLMARDFVQHRYNIHPTQPFLASKDTLRYVFTASNRANLKNTVNETYIHEIGVAYIAFDRNPSQDSEETS